MIRFFVLITLLSIGVLSGWSQNGGTLAGTITDVKTGEPLIGAEVILMETDYGAVTDIDGYYEITGIDPKTYNVSASYLGYTTVQQFNVIIKSRGTPNLNFELATASEELGEIVVSATSVESQVTPLSSQRLSQVEIATYPGGNNDIAKVVQSLPGVGGSVGGFRNDVIIRGGAPNENVYYLDGVEIPNINHFSTQGSAGGPVGLLNVSFIEDVDLATSAFHARYDNPLSGVLQFNQRVGDTRKHKLNFRVSASETAITAEGPIFRKGDQPSKTSFIVSARRSYLQLLFRQLGLPILPDYWDYQYKLTHKINDYNEINLIGVGAIDNFQVNELDEFDAEQQAVIDQVPIIDQYSSTTGVSWNRRFQDGSGSSRLVISTNLLDNNFTNYRDNVNQIDPVFVNESREWEWKSRYEVTQFLGDWVLTTGATLQHSSYENRSFSNANNFSYNTDIGFMRYGVFSQATRSFLDGRLDLATGLRFDGNGFIDAGHDVWKTFSPRAAVSYSLSADRKWKANATLGRYFKLPPFTVLGFQEGGQFINQDADYTRSDHAVVGLAYRPSPATRITLEGFYKWYANYPVSIIDGVSLANKGGGFEVLGNEPVTTDGKGRSYGAEFLVQQNLTANFYGIFAYTLFWSEFTGTDGQYRPSVWDSRHLATFTGGYKLPRNWEVSLRYRFAGRTPFAPLDQEATLAVYPAQVFDFDGLGSNRLATFNQADIRIDKKWNFDKWAFNLFFEAQNAFSQPVPQPPSFGLARDEMGTVITPISLTEIAVESNTFLPTIGIVVDL